MIVKFKEDDRVYRVLKRSIQYFFNIRDYNISYTLDCENLSKSTIIAIFNDCEYKVKFI